MNIELKKITKEQWAEQSNEESIIPQDENVKTVFFGIHDEGAKIGTILYGYDDEITNTYWIHAITIDEQHQGKDYEKEALASIVDWIRENFKNCTEIRLNASKDDDSANELYRNFGFVPSGEEHDGQDVLYLSVQTASD
ncbi:GNAT family N-acetyltransferase [Jeotgalibacillus sp. ET6]|uniref:GNAT family N-acetyltransferase n=1 Tax=Jeotgalibacillus sp. ET6 TaxID=3037260 RepID=UPI0024184919|nr:GNAT family N-acetyltransferase [Jeotgalibacillus sp. ET6]MDG5472049.1 GNAT family N-acetyltransferase [Jeotgalibacillus sp. ET6]